MHIIYIHSRTQLTEDLKTTVNELFAPKFGSKNMGPKLIFFLINIQKLLSVCAQSQLDSYIR